MLMTVWAIPNALASPPPKKLSVILICVSGVFEPTVQKFIEPNLALNIYKKGPFERQKAEIDHRKVCSQITAE